MTANGLMSLGFSGRICLTLMHSVWQVALFALAARAIERLCRRRSPDWGYALHVAALYAGLATLALTYALVAASDDRLPTVSHTAVAENQGIEGARSTSYNAMNAADRPETAVPTASSPAPAFAAIRTVLLRQLAPWIAAAYLFGVALMLLRLLAALLHAQRLAQQAKPLAEGPLLMTIQALARRWSMRVVPVLAETESVIAPRVVGLLRPVILLPASAVSGLSFDELELILGHELAHIRRHDMCIVLVQRVAEAALFFNPVLWYLSRRISTLREYCCDDAACPPHEQLRYAATLVRLIELAGPELAARANPLALAAQGRSPSELRRRVARLLGEPLREPLRLTRGVTLTAAVFLLLLAFLPAMTRSEPQPSGNSDAAKQKANPDAGAKDRFSFGGKIEVLALGTHEQNNDRWWNAQGNPLKPLPAPLMGCMVPQTDEQGKPLASLPITWKKDGQVGAGGVMWRRIIVLVRDLPDDADVTWNITGAQAYGGSEVSVNGERNPRGYFSRYFGIPAEQKTTAVKVGVATGKWKKAAEVQGHGMTAIGGQDLSLVFSETFDTPRGAAIVVSHNCFNRDFRVVALDKQGALHDTAGRGGASAGGIYQTRATFPKLKLDDIDHFEFQTRFYEYVELPGLPLEPTEKP